MCLPLKRGYLFGVGPLRNLEGGQAALLACLGILLSQTSFHTRDTQDDF